MYDLCQIIETVGSHEDRRRLFPQATKTTPGTSVLRGRYRFLSDQEFSVQSVLGGGEYGRVMLGTFGPRNVVLKRNVKVSMREDVNEVIMQTRLYCYLRDHHASAASHMARIPETIFAAAVPGFGRVLGMERMDVPLLAHVQKTSASAQVRVVRDALLKVCELLAVLQSKFSFMHGDLHGENVMVRGTDDVFLIDFGMSSAKFDRHPRTITSDRYEGIPFHPHLDLLTLVTALREDLGLSKHDAVAAWCGTFVDPFWTTVRTELLRDGGTSRTKLQYGARTTVRTARKEILSSGEVYYAHHLLYEDIGRVSYPPCDPRNMLRRLRATRSASPKRRLERERLFEDV